jgi:Concanavalin A-like lectin/glucanases superfamily
MNPRANLRDLQLGLLWLTCALAACCAHADPGTALHFSGTNSLASIPHSSTLNAYPLTLTDWVRTLRNASRVDRIVCRYQEGVFSGYSVHLYNGHLYAFFLRSGGSVLPTSLGIDGGAIADGNWHYIAFVIKAINGQLYVDGDPANSAIWSGTASPVTGTQVAPDRALLELSKHIPGRY